MEREYALAFLLSRLKIDELTRKRIERIIKQEINWYEVFRITIQEQTAYLVYRNLAELHYLWTLPGRLKNFWLTAYEGNIERNQQLLSQAQKIMQCCKDNNIPVFPIKGIELLQSVYQDNGIRCLSDMDFILSSEYISRLGMIMNDLNYHIVYINDEDIFLRKCMTGSSSLVYKKIVQSQTAGEYVCDFSTGMENQPLFRYLLQNLIEKNTESYHIAHALLLFLTCRSSVKNTPEKKYSMNYPFFRLLDIQVYLAAYFHSQVTEALRQAAEIYHIGIVLDEIQSELQRCKERGIYPESINDN